MHKVVVLIPHYNNPEGLKKSIASIDSSEKVDILVVDDGSSMEINEEAVRNTFKGEGIVLFEYLKKNEGIQTALNTGLHRIRKQDYMFVARLDCGDVNLKNRFHIQEKFLIENKDVGIVGSHVIFFKEEKTLFKLKLPLLSKKIKQKMYENAMLIHPSIMFRTAILTKIGLYPTKYKHAEDLAFFFKAMKKFELSNIDDYLVACEFNTNGLSVKNRKKQLNSRLQLIIDNFYFGYYPIKGLLKGFILYLIPVKIITKVKRIISN